MSKTLLMALILCVMASSAFAASGKTYQVTGPVLDVNEKTIVVQKGKEKWEVARDASTEVKVEPKTGDKVTVEYRMTAVSIEVKGAKTAKADQGKAKK